MKRTNITSSLGVLLYGEDIKPSLQHSISLKCYHNSIFNVKDLCKKTEQEFSSLFDNDEQIISIINKFLKTNGLSFGMTEEELTAYQDAEYYERHPEEMDEPVLDVESDSPSQQDDSEIPEIKVKHPSGFSVEEFAMMMQNSSKSPEEKKEEPVQLTYSLGQRIVSLYEEKWRKEMKKRLTDISMHRVCVDDIEFFKIHMFRVFYTDQPWYVKLFKNKKERINMAKEDAERMSKEYVEKLIDVSVNKRTEDLQNSLSSSWEKDWKLYMEELEKEDNSLSKY